MFAVCGHADAMLREEEQLLAIRQNAAKMASRVGQALLIAIGLLLAGLSAGIRMAAERAIVTSREAEAEQRMLNQRLNEEANQRMRAGNRSARCRS